MVTIRIFRLLANFPLTALSKSAQLIASNAFSPDATLGPFKRATSYNPNTLACALALVPPPEILDKEFPSILIGRPSLVFTKTGQESPPSTKVEA